MLKIKKRRTVPNIYAFGEQWESSAAYQKKLRAHERYDDSFKCYCLEAEDYSRLLCEHFQKRVIRLHGKSSTPIIWVAHNEVTGERLEFEGAWLAVRRSEYWSMKSEKYTLSVIHNGEEIVLAQG